MIFDDLIARELVVNLSTLAAATKFSQDAKDAVIIGTAACLSTIQFLRLRQIEGAGFEWSPKYSDSQAHFDKWAEVVKTTPRSHKEHRLTHPLNLRQMMKDLSKRDEPHLSTLNPYLYPARTFRLFYQGIEKPYGSAEPDDGPAGFLWSAGLSKLGDETGATLVHDHRKSV